MRLLIVDDEMWSRQLIKNVLPWDNYGFDEILEASNGEEAIKIYEAHAIDLTITDMRMPGIDGAMLLQYLRENDNQTEVIVMSGYEDYKYLHEALKTKAIDYLLKPVVREDLHRAVSKGIQRINENESYIFIEEIMRKDDLKHDFHSYYEYKSKLFNFMNESKEIDFLRTLDSIDIEYFMKELNPSLKGYVSSDLSRLIVKLETENNIINQKHDMSEINEIRTRFMNIFYIMRDTKLNTKISILEIQKYIDNHYTEVITLANIADRYYISKEHLSRRFKKEVGINMQQYITNKKMEYAKRLFRRYETLSISGVSVMAGYLDLQYFYRVFKKYTGYTPVQYKSEISILSND